MSPTPSTDVLHRFSFDALPVRGQWVRLQQTIADACLAHNYPDPVRLLLGKMFAAVAMFADNLKFDGAVALQSKGHGAIRQTLAECREHNLLRGIVHFAEDHPWPDNPDSLAAWLSPKPGAGEAEAQLALSLIPHQQSQQTTYQAFVPLLMASLEENLENYFLTSEQLPTRLFFAQSSGNPNIITGLLLQRLPSPDLATELELAAHEDAWQTLETLAGSLRDEELATLPPQTLLGRLFAQLPCRLHAPSPLEFRCTCSREKTDRTLKVFDPAELKQLLDEQGEITVNCEFCGQQYTYDAVDVGALTARLSAEAPGADKPGRH